MRRLFPFLLGALLCVAAAPSVALGAAPSAVITTDLTPSQAEAKVVGLINTMRRNAGKLPLLVDTRVVSVARQRSKTMDANDQLAHNAAQLQSLVSQAGITWYMLGENIGFNSWPTRSDSASVVANDWRNSPVHYGAIIDARYNYIGVGYEYDESQGGHYWTAVFLRGPDRTAPVVRMGTATFGTTTTTTRSTTVTWSGADVQLSALTAGFRNFDVARRVDGGTWTTFLSATTSRGTTQTLTRGHRYEYHVRGRDNVGNLSAWSAVLTVLP